MNLQRINQSLDVNDRGPDYEDPWLEDRSSAWSREVAQTRTNSLAPFSNLVSTVCTTSVEPLAMRFRREGVVITDVIFTTSDASAFTIADCGVRPAVYDVSDVWVVDQNLGLRSAVQKSSVAAVRSRSTVNMRRPTGHAIQLLRSWVAEDSARNAGAEDWETFKKELDSHRSSDRPLFP